MFACFTDMTQSLIRLAGYGHLTEQQDLEDLKKTLCGSASTNGVNTASTNAVPRSTQAINRAQSKLLERRKEQKELVEKYNLLTQNRTNEVKDDPKRLKLAGKIVQIGRIIKSIEETCEELNTAKSNTEDILVMADLTEALEEVVSEGPTRSEREKLLERADKVTKKAGANYSESLAVGKALSRDLTPQFDKDYTEDDLMDELSGILSTVEKDKPLDIIVPQPNGDVPQPFPYALPQPPDLPPHGQYAIFPNTSPHPSSYGAYSLPYSHPPVASLPQAQAQYPPAQNYAVTASSQSSYRPTSRRSNPIAL